MNIPSMAMAVVAPLMAATMADSSRTGPIDEVALHSATPNVLLPAGRKVSDGACEFIGADCRTSFVQSAGSDDWRGADMGAVLSIAFENAFDDAVALPGETGVAISPNLDDGEGAEDGARQVSGFQGFDMAASAVGVGEANSWDLPIEGSVGEVAEIPVAGRSCSMPRAAGDAAFFEEIGGAVAAFADANLLPPDTSAGENSVGQLQVVAGACAMRIDP